MSQQAVLLDINQIGNLMADQPEKTKDAPATVQDLRNMGIAIDANFIVIRSEMATGFAKVNAQFVKVESEIKSVRSQAKLESALLRSEAKTESALLRSEMAIGFAKVNAQFVKVESEFKSVRSEASEGFSKVRDEFAKLRTSAAYSLAVLLLAIIAIGISLGGLIISQS